MCFETTVDFDVYQYQAHGVAPQSQAWFLRNDHIRWSGGRSIDIEGAGQEFPDETPLEAKRTRFERVHKAPLRGQGPENLLLAFARTAGASGCGGPGH
jgi:hypothetical protein